MLSCPECKETKNTADRCRHEANRALVSLSLGAGGLRPVLAAGSDCAGGQRGRYLRRGCRRQADAADQGGRQRVSLSCLVRGREATGLSGRGEARMRLHGYDREVHRFLSAHAGAPYLGVPSPGALADEAAGQGGEAGVGAAARRHHDFRRAKAL